MNLDETKKEIYEQMKFSSLDIEQGERIYESLSTSASKDEFVNIYKNTFNGQLKDGFWVLDAPSKLADETKVAIINFAAHEPSTANTLDPKVELARNLFHSFNSTPVQGPQELYEIASWWINFELNENVRGALVTSLVDFTTVREEAKQKILELIPRDPVAIESLKFWLTHNFPRNYDYDFGLKVEQEIEKHLLNKVKASTKGASDAESRPPLNTTELLTLLDGKGFRVSFDYESRENPDPREMSQYEQPVIKIGDQQIDLWSQQVLYNEDLNLLCFLAESKTVRWGMEVTIANISSLQIASVPPQYSYEGEAQVVSATKNAFYIKVKKELLTIDISDFPNLKLDPNISAEKSTEKKEDSIIQNFNLELDPNLIEEKSTEKTDDPIIQNSYLPSGKIGGLAWVYSLLVSALILPISGAIYALIIWYLPIVFFNPVFTVLYIISIVVAHNLLVIEYGKVRNTTFANISGHIAIASSLYVHWVVWIALANGSEKLTDGFQYFLTHPFELLNTIWSINQKGTWWISGGTFRGWPLLFLWIIEALIVYLWAILSVKSKVRMPFSEASNEWFKCKVLPKMEFIAEANRLVEGLNDQNYDQLKKLEKEHNSENSHSIVKLYYTQKDEYYLTIDNYLKENREGNNIKFTANQIGTYIYLSDELGKHLMSLIEETPNPPNKSAKKMDKANVVKNSRANQLYCKVENDCIISNATDLQERRILLSEIWNMTLYQGQNVPLYLILRNKYAPLDNEFFISAEVKGFEEVLDFLFKSFKLKSRAFFSPGSNIDKGYFVLYRCLAYDNFKILTDEKFRLDIHKGYEILAKDRLFIPWGTSLEDIQNNIDIPKISRNGKTYIDCAIRFGPIEVNGPHCVFENEVELNILHVRKRTGTFQLLKSLIESLGEPMNSNLYEYGSDKIYRCRIEYIDFRIHYDKENADIPETNVTRLTISKLPTTSIALDDNELGKIAAEEYLFFAGENDERIIFSDGITMPPEDVKKIFGIKKGIWVNHTHQKIGFTADGYCSIYSLADISKIIFVDSIGRYKEPTQFRILLKNETEITVFQYGDWSNYCEEDRKAVAEVTGLEIADFTIDNTFMDHDTGE